MPNTIKIRNGTTTPSAASFQTAEPAFDRTASRLYIKNGAGIMVDVGAPPDASVTLAKLAASGRGVGYASTLLFG